MSLTSATSHTHHCMDQGYTVLYMAVLTAVTYIWP